MKLVPDTSVIIDGRVSERIADGDFVGSTIIVPDAVVAELESQANAGVDTGWDGLSELQRLSELAGEGDIDLEYVGRRPTDQERQGASSGDIDALIRGIAEDEGATIYTSDAVQSEVATAKGIPVEFVSPKTRDIKSLPIAELFDEQTMSLHLKANVPPMAKRGEIGAMHFERIDDEPIAERQLREWATEIVELAKQSTDGFIEMDEEGMQIIQYRDFRIAIARPPFSDGWEITAVRPLVVMSLEDYAHADELKNRLLARQRGVLISGSPGAGKTTFAQAVAEFLAANDYSVKTMEKPRDLQVGPEITQYTALDGKMEKTADSLLLVRPDYTIYDEVRKTSDFEVFADMRLAGVGMIGVVHASRPVDALQRLIGRVELGLIPQIVDTVIYIEAGKIAKVYDVKTVVKVPEGLTEEDLARPLIVISDFETNRPEYEIYSFNRQVVTVPLDEQESNETGVDRLARKEVEREIQSIARGTVDVEFANSNRAIVYVDESEISGVIGRGGGRISEIEDRLGIQIDVRSHDERAAQPRDSGASSSGMVVTPRITSNHVIVPVEGRVGETVEVQADGEYLFTATVGRGGEIQVSRGSAIAEELESAIDAKRTIRVIAS